ncbi:MAG TPA: hypothetical protein VEW91_03890, partial [bacterium]|nr:hypothetical protein [bacterium]
MTEDLRDSQNSTSGTDERPGRLTRREILAAGAAGLAGAALGAVGVDRLAGRAEGAAYGVPGMQMEFP